MGIIWVRCPATGKQASTGIEADASSFAGFPQQLEPVRCPICGMRHTWLKEDASLIDAATSFALLLRGADYP